MTAKKTESRTTPEEDREAWDQMQLDRIQPLEQVTQEQLATIRELQEKLKPIEAERRTHQEMKRMYLASQSELEMYRTIVKGWPKGKKLIKRLTRDPYDY